MRVVSWITLFSTGCSRLAPAGSSESPSDWHPECHGQFVMLDLDDQVVAIGGRISDEDGHLIEEEIEPVSVGPVYRTDWIWRDDLLLEVRIDVDGDGAAESVASYGYDADRRLVQQLSSLEDIRFEYDDEGHVVRESHSEPSGPPTFTRERLWEDDREILATSVAEDGQTLVTSRFVYDRPSPALDHQEYREIGATEQVFVRTFDPSGRLLTEDYASDLISFTRTQTWDDEGRLVERWTWVGSGDNESSTEEGWDYDADGLLTEDRTRSDLDDDGTLDAATIRLWSWEASCRPG